MITVKRTDKNLNFDKLTSLVRVAGYNMCVIGGIAESSHKRCSARVAVEDIPDGSYDVVLIPRKAIRLRTAALDIETKPHLFAPCDDVWTFDISSPAGLIDKVDLHTGLPISVQTAAAIWNSQGGGKFDIHYSEAEDRVVIAGDVLSAVLHIPEKTKNILLGGLTTEEHKVLKQRADKVGQSVSALLRGYVRDGLKPARAELTLTPYINSVLRTMSDLTGQTVNELVNEAMEGYIR